MANEIADRIAFFLKDYPPFSYLDFESLEQLSSSLTVRYLEEGETLFQEGNQGYPQCFVVRQGNILLSRKEGEHVVLVDQCEEGDILGVRSILTGNPYVLTATCQEESLIYEVRKELFEGLLDAHPKFALFFAAGYAAGQAVARQQDNETSHSFLKLEEQHVDYSQDVLTCQRDTTIQQAAKEMSHRKVGSIVVIDDRGFPQGIVTDTDLRNKVVATALSLEERIGAIMSSPVSTIGPVFTHSELLIHMMRKHVHHLVVTEDGSADSKIVGVISDHDVLLSQNNNPAALVKALRKSKVSAEWPAIRDKAEEQVADFIEKDLSVSLISNFITEINDQLIQNAIEEAMELVPDARKIPFCWLSLGSEGREEQLLRTDQDNAILFDAKGDVEGAQHTMLKLANHVNEALISSGFVACPADIMARNPAYCQDIGGWEKYFSKWIETPEPKALMNATIFFDFRHLYGHRDLANDLSHFLIKKLEGNDIFLNHLAANAIQNPPPLGFFKQFLVEKGGEHNEEFDIKKRAMMPLSDAARTLCLHYQQINIQNTPARFRKLAALDDTNQRLYEECAQAYEVLMKIRTKYGLKSGSSGRFVKVDSMNKLEKQMLKSAFLPIKEIQQLLEVRFQLAYFR